MNKEELQQYIKELEDDLLLTPPHEDFVIYYLREKILSLMLELEAMGLNENINKAAT